MFKPFPINLGGIQRLSFLKRLGHSPITPPTFWDLTLGSSADEVPSKMSLAFTGIAAGGDLDRDWHLRGSFPNKGIFFLL